MKPSEIRSRKLRAFKNCILKTCTKSTPESELRAIVKNWKRADYSLKSELDAVLTGLIAEELLEKGALGYQTTSTGEKYYGSFEGRKEELKKRREQLKAEEVAQYEQALSKFKVWLRKLPNLTVIQEQMQQWSYEWTPDNPISLQMLVTANSLLTGLQFVQSSDAVKLELIEMAINKKRAESRLPPLTLTPAPEAPGAGKQKLSRQAARVWEHIEKQVAVPTQDSVVIDLSMGKDTVNKAYKELRIHGLIK
jgi:hypothetical protein